MFRLAKIQQKVRVPFEAKKTLRERRESSWRKKTFVAAVFWESWRLDDIFIQFQVSFASAKLKRKETCFRQTCFLSCFSPSNQSKLLPLFIGFYLGSTLWYVGHQSQSSISVNKTLETVQLFDPFYLPKIWNEDRATILPEILLSECLLRRL